MQVDHPVVRAARIFEGQNNLARELGVSDATVSEWVSGRRPVPEKRCVRIEQLTGGAVTRRDLRPDDWREIWPELAANEPAAQAVAVGS